MSKLLSALLKNAPRLLNLEPAPIVRGSTIDRAAKRIDDIAARQGEWLSGQIVRRLGDERSSHR